MKRKIIAWCSVLIVVLAFVGLTFFLSGAKSINYGIGEGSISFTESDEDITELVIGSEGYTVAENENFILKLDGYANPIIVSKKSGKIWKSVAEEDGGNTKYSSSLILKYFSDNSTQITLYSSEDSVDKNQIKVFPHEKGVKVEYGFGEMSANYIYPEVIPKERFEKFISKMSEEDADYVLRRYTLYMSDQLEGQDSDFLLNKYPMLKEKDVYVVTNMSTKLMKKKTDEIFRKAGYTEKDKSIDGGNSGAQKKPQTFKVAVSYELTDNGFKTSVDSAGCQFYSDYPLTDISFLPYFDCVAGEDEGYFVIPSGSGAIIDAAVKEKETVIELPVYGDNISLTSKIEDITQKCSLPVFGQYKNNGGYLCMIKEGSQQAKIVADRNGIASSVSASFALLDSHGYSMTSSNAVHLFASDEADKRFCVEYVLFDSMERETAYSEMANYYRSRLINEGVLTKKEQSEKPVFLAEFINAINYDDLALGFIPVNREFTTTSFEEVIQISDEMSKYAENLNILLTGWNSKGLNRQKLGGLNFSKNVGGKKGYLALLEATKDKKINTYVDLNFTHSEDFFNDGFSVASEATRGIDNSIVKISVPDALTKTYKESNFRLISPKIYNKMWKSYNENDVISKGGIGVSELTGTLYGDYADDKLFGRKQSINEVIKVLKSAEKKNISILGDVGNLYALPYMDVINNLSSGSTDNTAYYRDIPFVQLVLHGYIDYVTESLSGSQNTQKALLKLIETGSGLHYTVTKNSYEKLFETEYSHIYNTAYDALKEEMRENYGVLNTALDGLCDKTIVEHFYITDDVVCVTYENGAKIYVNYGSEDYEVNGIVVPDMDYRRVG